MNKHTLSVPRFARYYTLGPGPGSRAEVLLCLHGYGQLAGDFLGELASLAPALTDGRQLVAPEALARFYLRRGRGVIGASWMTREEREEEVRDYLCYLDTLHDELGLGREPDVRISVLGFSQGAATAARWALLGKGRVERVVLWGGGVPPDLDLGHAVHAERLAGMRFVLVAGDRDPALPAEARAEERRRLDAAGVSYELAEFAGGHELDARALGGVFGV